MSLLNTFRYLLKHPLNRTNKTGAVLRYLKWQVRSRAVQGDLIHEWINGSKLMARSGDVGVTGNIYCGLWEFSDMAFLLHVLEEDDFFVDIGANIGSYTILASSAQSARTLCFEPVPSTYDRLLKNIELNQLESSVSARNLALGASQGTVDFSSDSNCTNHALAENEISSDSISVPVSTLDDELTETPFIMKIDVEGYESLVIQGAEKTLQDKALRVIIIELNGSGERYGFDESKILDTLTMHGFKAHSYDPFNRELVSLEEKNSVDTNTIFIRDVSDVSRRISKAKPIQVHGAVV